MSNNTSGNHTEKHVGSLGFFTGISVDDKKYESLLDDLRAHDLLGPIEDDIGFKSISMNLNTKSFLLHDNLSAIFTGNVHIPKSEAKAASASKPKPTKAPPGFGEAAQGTAPTQADLEWARSQQEFQLLRQEFTKSSKSSASTGSLSASASAIASGGNALTSFPFSSSTINRDCGLHSEEDDDSFDESLLPKLDFESLGLVDDEEVITNAGKVNQQGPNKQQAPITSPPKSPSHWKKGPPPGMEPPLPSQLPTGPCIHQPPPSMPHSIPPPPPLPSQPPQPPLSHPSFLRPPPPPHFQHMHHQPPPPPPQPMFVHPPRPMAAPQDYEMMTVRDIQFVIQQQMKQIRCSDPFSDDYYFHHIVQKQARLMMLNNGPQFPLPSWKLEHVRSCDPRDTQRANKSRTWENENQVLGRTSKTSLYRPRELLNLSFSNDPASNDANDKDEHNASNTKKENVLRRTLDDTAYSVFHNKTWSLRHVIDRGNTCLLALQDARHILDARRINVQQFHQMDPNAMDPALVELRTRTSALLLELASVLGITHTSDSNSTLGMAMTCRKTILFSILTVLKGRKLVARALPLLHPSARFVLFPLLMEYLLNVEYIENITKDKTEEEEQGDDRLAKMLVVTLMYHPPLPPPDVLAQSLKVALKNHNLTSLSLVLHNRARAEILQALLQQGGVSCEASTTEIKLKWMKYQDLFVELASKIKQGDTN